MSYQKKQKVECISTPSSYTKPVIFSIGGVNELTLGGRGQTTDSGVGYTRSGRWTPW